MIVRQLTVADLAAYRALHRFALIEAPSAFVENSAIDDARSDDVVRGMFERGEGWGVFEGERLLGKLAIDALPYPVLGHVRWLHAIYMHPDGRGSGAGEALMNAAMDHEAQRGALRFALWVSSRNAAARKFYEKLGFRETGRVPQGISDGAGGYIDDVLMTRAMPGSTDL